MPDTSHPNAPPPPPASRSPASHAEAERRALRTLLWAIEHCPAAIMITDREGRIVYVNPRFSAINGYGRTEVLHRNPRFLKSEASDPALHRALWAALATGEDWRGTLCNRRADGNVYAADVAIAPVKDAADHVSHFVAVYGEPRPLAPAGAHDGACDGAGDAAPEADGRGAEPAGRAGRPGALRQPRLRRHVRLRPGH